MPYFQMSLYTLDIQDNLNNPLYPQQSAPVHYLVPIPVVFLLYSDLFQIPFVFLLYSRLF